MASFNTRISLKYDTLANWEAKNPVLFAGEVAIATVSTTDTNPTQSTPPLVLMKVGDGTTAYKALPYLSARSQDVYAWAKAATKPSYAATEITGIDSYIASYVNEQMGISVDTDTQYTITKVNDYQYKLMSKAKGDSSFSTQVAVIDIPSYDDSEVTSDIDALEKLVGTTSVADQIAAAIAALNLGTTYEVKGTAAQLVNNLANGAVAANTAAINAIKDGASIDSFADVEAQLATKQAVGDYATKTEAKGYADAKDGAIASAAAAAAAAQGDVDALEGEVAVIEGKVTTLVGEDSGKSARTIAAEVIASSLANADEDYNTLQEMSDWISGHAESAAAMNSQISALESGLSQANTDIDAVEAAVATKAAQADLNAAVTRVADLEEDTHTHSNKALLDTYTQTEANLADAVAKKHSHSNATVLDGITAAKVSAWDAAETNAKEYAGSLNTAMDTRVKAVESTSHTHSNKTVLDEITSTRVAAWDAAEANAREHVDDEIEKLHAVATSGDIADLEQSGDYIVFNCGTASTVI